MEALDHKLVPVAKLLLEKWPNRSAHIRTHDDSNFVIANSAFHYVLNQPDLMEDLMVPIIEKIVAQRLTKEKSKRRPPQTRSQVLLKIYKKVQLYPKAIDVFPRICSWDDILAEVTQHDFRMVPKLLEKGANIRTLDPGIQKNPSILIWGIGNSSQST